MPKKNPNPTALEAARRSAGMTRSALSKNTGVPLRTIEAYEQRKNQINKASADTVRSIASALKVPMESIMEK